MAPIIQKDGHGLDELAMIDAVESSLQTSRALIAPMMRLAADASDRSKKKVQDVSRGSFTVVDGKYTAEERRRIRAERKAAQLTAGQEVDVWGKVKKERFDLPEMCQYDEQTYDDFEIFCATRIQAAWRMFLERQKYRRVRWAIITIQRYFRVWGLVMRPKKIKLNESATVIQRAWRSMIQRRTFAQIRDIIRFRGSGDPIFLLKVLAPSEADFADEASGVHIRFRLGGTTWPPTIFYKVFTHRNIADIGAFAPRDYNHEIRVKQDNKRKGLKEAEEDARNTALYDEKSRKRWYRRAENNGWRPLNEQAFGHMILEKQKYDSENGAVAGPDFVLINGSPMKVSRSIIKKKETQRSTEFFHPLRSERRAKKQMKARRKQYEWMQKVRERVANARRKEKSQDTIQEESKSEREFVHEHTLEDETTRERVKDDDEFLQDFMDEESDLLAWTTALDYEAYLSDWHSNATTISTENRRNTLGYESWLAIREAQEKATDFEFSMQDYNEDLRRAGSFSKASIYTEEDSEII